MAFAILTFHLSLIPRGAESQQCLSFQLRLLTCLTSTFAPKALYKNSIEIPIYYNNNLLFFLIYVSHWPTSYFTWRPLPSHNFNSDLLGSLNNLCSPVRKEEIKFYLNHSRVSLPSFYLSQMFKSKHVNRSTHEYPPTSMKSLSTIPNLLFDSLNVLMRRLSC